LDYLVGVDGCCAGWITAEATQRSVHVVCRRINTLDDLFSRESKPKIVAIDVPIGLPEAGARECDLEARRLLGPRRNSVFTAPIRPMLLSSSQEEASKVRSRVEGKRVSIQAFAIIPKIREVDQMLCKHASWRAVVREVHPEVSFFYMNGRMPMRFSKKKALGREERITLLRSWCGNSIDESLATYRHLRCKTDDIIDAFAALWSAQRFYHRESVSLPSHPPFDRYGLKMEIIA
jgi:predicted RNase H-like nuclease